MSEPQYRHLTSDTAEDVLVLTIREKELREDDVCKALESEMADAMSQLGAKKVAVDLRHVEYIGSIGITALLGFNHKLCRAGGRMVVCNLCRFVADVFETTRLLIGSRSRAAPFEGERDLKAALANLTGAVADE